MFRIWQIKKFMFINRMYILASDFIEKGVFNFKARNSYCV